MKKNALIQAFPDIYNKMIPIMIDTNNKDSEQIKNTHIRKYKNRLRESELDKKSYPNRSSFLFLYESTINSSELQNSWYSKRMTDEEPAWCLLRYPS